MKGNGVGRTRIALFGLAAAILLGLGWLGWLGGDPFTLLRPAAYRARPGGVVAVLLSGDMGFNIGMGPQVAGRLQRDGIPVVGVNSLTYFRTTRTPAEAAMRDKAEWADLLWRLRDQADALQGRLLLYQISPDMLPLAIELGLQITKYGEEAHVDLNRFSLEGPDARPLRYAERRAAREGASFEIVPAADLPAIMDELGAISARWLAAKGHREKGFSVGRFDPAYIGRFDCAVVRRHGHIVAFANIWATGDKSELSVDLMRHEQETPYGTMDFLFVHLMQWGRTQGYGWFNLGMAPLSGLEARRLAPLWSKLGALLYQHGGALYGFEGLRAYKEKFSPEWEGRFVAGPQGLSFARALIDLQSLIGSGAATER